MSKQHSLHSFRATSALSRYGLVFLLLFSFVIAKLYVDHDASHLITPDNHCALCLSAAGAEHALPPTIIIVDDVILPLTTIPSQPVENAQAVVSVLRNRGPPENINS